jgi:hypothetical protein
MAVIAEVCAGIDSLAGITREQKLRITLSIVGIVLAIFGCIWFLQGINVLPGSFMTGQIQWAVYGGIAVVVGAGLLFWANRRKRNAE